MATLADSPDQMVTLLRKHLAPVSGGDKRIKQLIRDLDSDDFDTRQAASHELALQGEAAAPALLAFRANNNPSVEANARIESLLDKIPTLEDIAPDLRTSRALELLDSSATLEARRLLQHLATGDPHAWLTREALASFDRLKSEPV